MRDKHAKSRYDKARYPRVRASKIASASRWYDEHKDEKHDYDVARRPVKNAKRRAQYAADPTPFKASNRRTQRACSLKRYGLTTKSFDALLEFQGDRCACCRSPTPRTKRWCVDHDHKTGKVRGIVCGLCNTGIGHLGDDIEGVLKGLVYLYKHHGLAFETVDEHW